MTRDKQSDPAPDDRPQRPDVPSKGEGSDGYGGGGAGTEHTRTAHPRGETPTTGDDPHPGAGWEDSGAGPAQPDPTQAPTNTAGDDPKGRTTNRPGGNRDVEPRTSEKTIRTERPQRREEKEGDASAGSE